MKVLVLGGERVVNEVSVYVHLRWPDAQISSSFEGTEWPQFVEEQSPDLLFIDMSLPRVQPVELLTTIRSFSDVPIILLSDKGNELDRARGLEAGADDCIVRPFEPIDFLARVRAVLRRAHGADFQGESRPFKYGELSINFATREVFLAGERAHLTPIEYRLLRLLVRNEGRVVPHETVLERVWGPRYDDSAYIKKYIYRLRRKLGDDEGNPRILLSERGTGYRFAVPYSRC